MNNYYTKYESLSIDIRMTSKNEVLKNLYGGKHIHLKTYSLDTKSFCLIESILTNKYFFKNN
jgi:hypothetical protein